MFEQSAKDPSPSIAGYQVEQWLSEDEIRSAPYFDYWNDEQIEKLKPWHVKEHGFEELNRHLEETGLIRQLENCLDAATRLDHPVCGVGADLACGVFWTAGRVLKREGIKKLYGVEYSKHRLLKISPSVLHYSGVPAEKVVLCLGSFYHLHLPDASLDFVILAEAFHHAADPERLLREVRRALKPQGVVLILGEHITPGQTLLYVGHIAKSVASHVLSQTVQRRLFGRTIPPQTLFPSLPELLKPDPVMGDHYYLPRQYREMFSSHRFHYEPIRTPGCPFQAFVLY